ncbi:MAG: hypothetical protein WAM04_05940, partial [Candidatus Sulfotelmatobacter sp.]
LFFSLRFAAYFSGCLFPACLAVVGLAVVLVEAAGVLVVGAGLVDSAVAAPEAAVRAAVGST